MAKTTEAASSARNWREDQANGYVAHFNPSGGQKNADGTPQGQIEGPDDAFVWFGLPYAGPDDRALQLGSVLVEWIAWDAETGCSVYRRVA